MRGDLAGDLDTIVGKALRIAPDERYGSAAHLADDLERYLDQQAHRRAARRASGMRRASRSRGTGWRPAWPASDSRWWPAPASSPGLQYRESRAHAERTAAVRNFMFDLVSDAEIPEGQESEVTGKQMIDGAVLRARRDYRRAATTAG